MKLETLKAIVEIQNAMVGLGLWREDDGLMDVDEAIRAAQERLHRQIGQWARVGHRRVREKALQARLAMGLEDRVYRPRPK